MDRIVNRNKLFYGPGPLARKGFGLAAKPPLRAFYICAAQAFVISMIGGFGYNYFSGDPMVKKIEDYYKENPVR